MRFSGSAVLAALCLVTEIFAAPTQADFSVKRQSNQSTDASSILKTFTAMGVSVNNSQSALNANAAANGGKATLMASMSAIMQMGGALTENIEEVGSAFENPVADVSIEVIEVWVEVLDVWSEVLQVVEGTVDAVVNAFFPGLVDEFNPFIQIWIDVVDEFLNPFLDFYSQLVGSLTDSPELATEINDLITVIEQIRDDFLLSF